MSTEHFNKDVQIRFNGPLTDKFKERIKTAREKTGCTYSDIGKKSGLSAPFVGNLARGYPYEKPLGIRTIHVSRLVGAIEFFEAKANGSSGAVNATKSSSNDGVKKGISMKEAKEMMSIFYEVDEEKIEIFIKG